MKDSVKCSAEAAKFDKCSNGAVKVVANGKVAASSTENQEKGDHKSKKRKRKARKLQCNDVPDDTGSICTDSKRGDNAEQSVKVVAESPGHEKENVNTVAPKMNAFQFMMNSRHKSIGRNSPGRDGELNEFVDTALVKKEMKARKARLENWAEAKGAKKRKREYEEVGKCISYKLEKRERKLKKMLNISCQSDEVIRKRKKCAVIESDGESCGEAVIEEKLNKKGETEKKGKSRKSRLSLNKTPKKSKIEEEKVKLTPNSVKTWKFKIKLSMEENALNCDSLDDKSSASEITPDALSQNEITLDSLIQNDITSDALTQNDITPDAPTQNDIAPDALSKNEITPDSLIQNEITPDALSQNVIIPDSLIQNDITLDTLTQNEVTPVQSEITPNTTFANQSQLIISDENEVSTTVISPIQSEITPDNTSPIQNDVDANCTRTEIIVIEEYLVKEQDDSVDNGKRVLRTRKSKPKIYDDYVLTESDEEKETIKKKKTEKEKPMKVAPVFLKAVPKPKLDPKVAEARRQFLLSGVPSSLKKEMEKQQCVEDVDFDVFPTVSHVQQRSDHSFWDLPKAELSLTKTENSKIQIEPFINMLALETPSLAQAFDEEQIIPNKIKNYKKIVKEIKSQNPKYPVYKIFNSIYHKSCHNGEKPAQITKEEPKPKRRGRPKKELPNKSVEIETIPIKSEENRHAMWTEKYKATVSADIIGNHGSVSSLKEWLTNWLNTTQDLKKRKTSCDSESEFEATDSDSRDSTRMCGNTVILKGPTGCGKTAAVYAVCNELGFSVLEVNASSKRTGKRLLAELQEATQSHQVRKKENLLSFTKEKKKTKASKPKMCVLLVEDIDIVFDQDEGFTAALSQIIATSKRPIILTTTDEPSPSVQKIINDYRTISFSQLSSILTVWLQIVCLVEGYYVEAKSIEELLSCNRGDIRRTLLQLQLWVNSGGQLKKSDYKTEITELDHDIKIEDDNSNLPYLKADDGECREIQVHGDCVGSSEILEKFRLFSLPHCNNFEIIWWNLPSILNLPDFSSLRLERNEKSHSLKSDLIEKEKLKALSDCYDSLAFADVICGKGQFHESLERTWQMGTKDGLGLEESISSYNDDFCSGLGHTLMSGRIGIYKERFDGSCSGINLAVPVATERRWRSKQISCENRLQEALLESDFLERKSKALDYMPALRSIARSECERAANNTKRGNRFYNYLRNLGVHGGDTTYKLACDVFKV